jgi:hypothetical protein
VTSGSAEPRRRRVHALVARQAVSTRSIRLVMCPPRRERGAPQTAARGGWIFPGGWGSTSQRKGTRLQSIATARGPAPGGPAMNDAVPRGPRARR